MPSDPTQSTLDNQRLETISVEDFFRQINWYGRSLPGIDDVAMADAPYETVGQFFATFPWQGSMVVVSSDDWDEARDDEMVPIANETLTLEDLSALF